MAVIWTTTPWTIPSNQALNVNPELVYALVATDRGHLVLAQDLAERCLSRFKLEGQVVATAKGAALELIRFRHPLYDRASPVYLGSYVTLEQGTGIVHSSPAYGIEDFPVVPPLRHEGRRDPESVGGDGRFAGSLPFFGGERSGRRIRRSWRSCASEGALLSAEKFTHSYMHCWRHRTPIIYRATTQWFAGWTRFRAGTAGSPSARCAKRRSPASMRRSFSLRGARRGSTDDREPARLDAVAPAAVGRADAVLHA
jgi:isoleucyl-tRNA synthetase